MLKGHSPVGASGMGRWNMDACPGSVLAEAEAGPNVSGFPAQEGTAAHELAETCISNGLPAACYIGKEFNGIPVDDEMAEHVQGYVDYSHTLAGERFIEWGFHLPEVHDLMHGTLDLAAIDNTARLAHVCDFKYGRTYVPAKDNVQLKYYALALVLEHELMGKIDLIALTIYQPRIWGRLENFETDYVTPEELLMWRDEVLIPSMELALQPDAPRKSGPHCQYCRAKVTCSTFLDSAQAALGYTVPLSNEQIAYVLDMEKPIANMVKDAQKAAVEHLMLGQNIPGYKPVRQFGRSKIIDTDRCAAELIELGIGTLDIYDIKLKGITALKQIKGAKSIVTKYVDRPAGGIKAVPLSSTQPAVAIATEMFDNKDPAV